MQFVSDRITVDEKICGGKPTVRGKRITVIWNDVIELSETHKLVNVFRDTIEAIE